MTGTHWGLKALFPCSCGHHGVSLLLREGRGRAGPPRLLFPFLQLLETRFGIWVPGESTGGGGWSHPPQ